MSYIIYIYIYIYDISSLRVNKMKIRRYLLNMQETFVQHTPTSIPDDNKTRVYDLDQCFSTAGPQPGTGPQQQLYRP